MRLRPIGLIVSLAIGILVAALAADARRADPVRRIGVLGNSRTGREVDGFQQGLRDQGYVEGRNLLVEWRFIEGREDRLRGFADELVSRKVELIVVVGSLAAIAAKNAATTMPIVFMLAADPVAMGLVASLARPGGNTTGFSILGVELAGKRLELLKEAVPTQIPPGHARAVVLAPGVFVFVNRVRIAELATKSRLPLLGWQRQLAESGALVSYGANHFEVGRLAAGSVDKILKGVKPGDLPVQQPTKFELVINLKTAKALGLTIPQSVLIRADEVIK